MGTEESAADALLKLDQTIDEAASDADFGRLDALLADDFVYAHSTGTVQSKDEWLASLKPLVGRRRRVVSGARAELHDDVAWSPAMWTSSGTIAIPSSTGTSASIGGMRVPGGRSRSARSRARSVKLTVQAQA